MHIVLKKKAFGQVRSTLFFSFEYSIFNLYILQAYSNYREQGGKATLFLIQGKRNKRERKPTKERAKKKISLNKFTSES